MILSCMSGADLAPRFENCFEYKLQLGTPKPFLYANVEVIKLNY